jgi:nucleotide-binding universal stress UspA family protein
MSGSIIVPLDGSAFSAKALATGAAIARKRGATLHLLSVHTPLVIVPTYPNAPAYDNSFDEAQREALQTALQEYAERLKNELGITPKTAVFEGDPAVVLSDEAVRRGASLIVMTTHGRGGFTRAWLGSVADELLRRSPVPLLIVRPPDAEDDEGAEMAAGSAGLSGVANPADISVSPTESPYPFHRVLVPLDGSSLAEEILETALALGVPGETSYVLLRIVPVPKTVLPPDETFWTAREIAAQNAARESAATYLEGTARRVREAGHPVETAVVLGHDIARTVMQEGTARGIDLFAISTHARGGLARLRLGSVADKIVRGAACPTLVARPKGSGTRSESMG